jgi:hypothetical protein
MKIKPHTPQDFDRANSDTLRVAVTYDCCGAQVDVFAHRDAAGAVMYTAAGHYTSGFHTTPEAAVEEINHE